jgi:hypothetical protein
MVVFVTAPGVAGSEATRAPGVPPVKPGAGLYVCPSGFSVAAYRSSRAGKVSFAALHPLHPGVSVRIARCFASLASAKRAGYRPAPLPPGDALVHGIYLLPTGSDVHAACQASADAVGFPVPCPGLLPTHAYWQCPCVSNFGFLLMAWGAAPSNYVGDEPGSIHLVFAASLDPASPWVTCADATSLGSDALGGINGALMDCSPASETNGGHMLFSWQTGGLTYVVSAHGHSSTNRELLAVLMRHLTVVSPAP